MTALSTRNALVRALVEPTIGTDVNGYRINLTSGQAFTLADALLASGAVIDADTLADELRSMGEVWGGDAMWLTSGTKVADLMAETVAAALADRGEGR